jgi:NAD(P)-dependent dehydrogenase (short-subunit alcohol dehydrogenase family)
MRRRNSPYHSDCHRGTAVVTGGSAGVGRATVRALATAGFDVGVLARGSDGVGAAVRDVQGCGRRGTGIVVDVATAKEVDRAASDVEAELGPIDLWVNNAMTTIFGPVQEIDPGDFLHAVETTFLGQVWGTKAALARMCPRDRGTIVNVGSSLSYLGIPLQSPYCAAKFACRGFSQSVRTELIHSGSHVRIAMVHLPAVNTPQFAWCRTVFERAPQPVPPIYPPERAARRIVSVALDGRRSSILGFWNRVMVVLGTAAPAFAEQYAAIGAWTAQLSNTPKSSDRPDNLYEPADGHRDMGAAGPFRSRALGTLDPVYIASIPSVLRNLVRAASAAYGHGSATDATGCEPSA